jgi:hypothetical protein
MSGFVSKIETALPIEAKSVLSDVIAAMFWFTGSY